ncbi:SDR family oxidoreductase [Auritidibacter ignavus]|uniref:SDR family oxidoreductase n=1 Tax=Auritidibacter ignavus TaxID=678932 RepID=UPI00109C33DC|nr:SDR family NAD(P)-dependent oxidoreductase [Auritidibacter ignavus]
MTTPFTDQVAIVTGAGGGIGAALAQALLDAGARVLLTDLDQTKLDAQAEALATTYHDRFVTVAGNAASLEDIRGFRRTAHETFEVEAIDLYVANAGIAGAAGLEVSDDDWNKAIEINVMAHVRAAQVFIPDWIERGSGHFLSTASAAGLLTQIGSAVYAVTKHAAVSFAEWLSITYGHQGIDVSCLCPLGVNTNLLMDLASADDASRAAHQSVTARAEVLSPEQVAEHTLAALERKDFLILPHEQLKTYISRKNSDYPRWMEGMRRYQDTLLAATTSDS